MPDSTIFTTAQVISAAREWLGRPDTNVLRPSTMCVRLWAVLGKLQSLLNISDRTHFLAQQSLAVAENQTEIDIPEVESFGGELGLDVVRMENGFEVTYPITLLSDWRDRDKVPGLAACVFRATDGRLLLRFNQPFPQSEALRFWYEPGSFGRPKLGETPLLPDEAMNLLIIELASACLPELVRVYEASVYQAYASTITEQKMEFRQIFEIWRLKDRGAGAKKIAGYNNRRRSRVSTVRFDYGE